MSYTALNVAKYIVTYCAEQNAPISNLKLQKILYYTWVDYYKETGRTLFWDEICAWQLGPVVPDVYYYFCSYAGFPITQTFDIDMAEDDKDILNSIISTYSTKTAGTLVSMTHRNGSPWDRIYRGGYGLRDVIPFSLIKQLELGRA